MGTNEEMLSVISLYLWETTEIVSLVSFRLKGDNKLALGLVIPLLRFHRLLCYKS